jgi:hypothetical protein
MHTPPASEQPLNVQRLRFKDDPKTIEAMTEAQRKWEAQIEANRAGQQQALYRLLRVGK